ncbi:MAG: citramalate synthase [Eubacteriales bacterium]|nr:citramalate synthase [Eubacteriales bacterium]
MGRLEILDTTLRDGAQGEGISFTVSDKLNVVKALDELGVAYIEAGNPGSNPKDMEFFRLAGQLTLQNATLVAFGSTRRKNMPAEQDDNVRSLLLANTPAVSIFGKCWKMHVTEILRATPEENLVLVEDTLRFLTNNGKEVIFDAEHFYDGYKDDPAYALSVLEAACRGGAGTLCLCDTNGGALPLEIYEITQAVCARFADKKVGVHCHNDAGCAVANSLLAVKAGARHVQGTFTGIGERCGNADLSVILPNLQLKMGYQAMTGHMSRLYDSVRKVSEICNMPVGDGKPFTGSSAFAHKGGMHIDGVSKTPRSFEHIDPEWVGNKRRFLLSEVSGKQAVLLKLNAVAPELTKDSPQTARILEALKEREHEGYQYEAADASFELLVKRVLGKFEPHFKLIMYKTFGEFPPPEGDMTANAMVKVDVGGNTEITAALGNGPVHALDQALRKALGVFYPALSDVHLTDYKVRMLETGQATGSRVRVLIVSSDGNREWTTVGASSDIIEASFAALVDSIEYKLCWEESRWA